MKVQGKNVVVFIYDGMWKMYACAKSATLEVITDFIETSVSGTGLFATYLPTKNSFTGSLDGVTSLEEESMLSLPDLRQRQITQQLLLMRFQRTDDAGNVYTDEASFYISSSSDTGSFDDMNLFSIDLRGTGVLTQIFTPVNPPIDGVEVVRYEYTGVGGETGFTDSSLIGKYILEVNKDGVSNARILTSGTPVGKEVKYVSATGQFLWAIEFEPGEEIFILYQNI
jgi:hypothetical protein